MGYLFSLPVLFGTAFLVLSGRKNGKVDVLALWSFMLLMFASAAPVYAASISGQGTWETTLHARDVNNDGTVDAYYDSVLNISWLADANYAVTSGWIAANTPYPEEQRVTHANALLFVNDLNGSGFLGVNTWRMPDYFDLGDEGHDSKLDIGLPVDPASGELAHMYYTTLGNSHFLECDYYLPDEEQDPDCTWDFYPEPKNTALFENLVISSYWYQQQVPQHIVDQYQTDGRDYHYDFGFYHGDANWSADFTASRVWLVTDGDIGVTAVPVPAAVWLLGSALAGLGLMRRRPVSRD